MPPWRRRWRRAPRARAAPAAPTDSASRSASRRGLLDHRGGHPGAGAGVIRLPAQQGESLAGQGVEAAQPLLHRLQAERGAAGQVDGVADLGQFDVLGAEAVLVQLLLQHDALRLPLRLAAGADRQRGAQGDDLVGEEPGARIPHGGGDRLGLLGDFGLAAQRLQLAPDLPGEVAEAGEVHLHRVELAERLLLAPAVLEDARGLLDEAAAFLGARPQHRVQLALPDDDVHFAAEPGVAEQFLHIQQPAVAAVDGVVAGAVAEQGAADRDLGVLDRQGAIRVVDGEDDLGAAERSFRGGAGEDDVLHLAAAQRLGALLAHHPGERIHDVGFARSVRADDAGHPGLEREGRRACEGLEPLEREALQVHRIAPSASCRTIPATTVPDAAPPAGMLAC